MILVTGAAGKTGRAVIRALAQRGQQVTAFVHRPNQSDAVTQAGASVVAVGSMTNDDALRNALTNVRAVYHIAPNVSPDEVLFGRKMIDLALAQGIQHFVYHSVLHPQTEEMPHHWQKLRVEELLLKSGLAFTILQPAIYMQNVLARWSEITAEGVYRVPYAADTRLGMVDLEDVAAAAAIVLTSDDHHGATYELAGSEILSQYEVADVLGECLSRPIRVEVIPRSVWEADARHSGMGEYQVPILLKMFEYYEKYGLGGNPRVVSWLLGRPPIRFGEFVRKHLTEHKQR